MQNEFPPNEQERLAALRAYDILDTPPEDTYDELVKLAANICETPIALLTLVDADRVWFKASLGTTAKEVPRDQSFCRFAILQPEMLEVPDAQADPQFSHYWYVKTDPGLRFYAAMPLMADDDCALGTLCVIDRQPRRLNDLQRQTLRTLGKQVITQMKLRYQLLQEQQLKQLLEQQAEEINDLYNNAPCGYHLIDKDRRILRINDTELNWLGYTREELLGQHASIIFPAWNHQNYVPARERFFKEGKIDGVELELQRRDGTLLKVVANSNTLRDAEGNMVASRSTFHDLTERFKMEAELEAARKDLELKVTERTAELRRLSQQVVEAQEAERRQIARELHDEVGQLLTGLKLQVENCHALPNTERQERLAQIETQVSELMQVVRGLALRLRPPMLDDLGLLPALNYKMKKFTEQTGLQINFVTVGIEARRFPTEVETAAYRIVQEALTNVARHAQTAEANVRVWLDQNKLHLQIEDSGAGFDSTDDAIMHTSIGLSSMRERAALLGGSLQIVSAPAAGTNVFAEIPVCPEVENADHFIS